MPYLTQSEIQVAIPAPHLIDALDDDADGVADAALLDTIIASASNAVDAYLASIYTVPFGATVSSGNVAEGSKYLVVGGTSVTYNSIVYVAGQTFLGVADVLTFTLTAGTETVQGVIPAAVKEAAFIFSCELIYARREAQPNPFKDRADNWRKLLAKIGAGEMNLDATTPLAVTPGAAITTNTATAASTL